MRMTKPLLTWAALAMATAAIAVSPAAALEEFKHSETETFELGSLPHIALEAISGDVVYKGRTGTTATVEVVYTIKAESATEADAIRSRMELLVEGVNGSLEARMVNSKQFYQWMRDEYSRNHSASVSFYVSGPSDAEGVIASVSGEARASNMAGPLSISSVSGDVVAVDVQKHLRVNSVSGQVDVQQAGGPVVATSVSGDVLVASCGGDLDIESVSGTVLATSVKGNVTAETVSGEIELKDVALGVDAQTVSGSVWIENHSGDVHVSSTSGYVTVLSRTDGNIEIESVSGSVELSVVPGNFGDVSLSVGSGEIETDTPLKVTRKTSRRLEGALGDGTARLRVSTSSGDIVLSEL